MKLVDKVVDKALNEIKPYWRNPRRIPEDAIENVAASIREYGFQQPLVVDAENVIIVGHTRYAAARRLGMETAPTIVATSMTPQQAREYRLVDNKAAELSEWDWVKLSEELRQADDTVTSLMFNDVMPDTAEMMEGAEDIEHPTEVDVEFICPSCYYEWEVTVTEDAVFAGSIKGEKK